MKKAILSTLIIFLIFFVSENRIFSQSKFQVDYYSNFSAMDMDLFAGVKKSSSGFAIAGTVEGFSLPLLTGVLIQTDTMGTVLWAKKLRDGSFIPTKNLFINDLQTTSSGGFIMTGNFNDNYAMLVKVDGSGNSVFSYQYGKSPNEFGYAVKELSAGAGYIVGGATYGKSMNTAKDSSSIYIFKTNSAGAYQWGRSYSLTSGPVFDSHDAVNDVVEVPTGYVFAGYTSQQNGVDTTTNILVFKTDASGTLQWMKTYGELGYNEEASSIKLLSNGNLLVGGYTDKVGLASSITVLELDGSGNLVSSTAYGVGGLADMLGSIQQTATGFSIVGWTIGLNYKSFLLTLNSSYAPVTAKTYNSFIGGLFTKGEQVPGGYLIGSMIGTTSYQLHMIKTDASGSSGSGCTEATVTTLQYSYTPPVTSVTPTEYTGGSGSTFTINIGSVTPTTTVECITLPLAVDAGNNQTTCSGTGVTIGGSPTANYGTSPYTFAWSPATGLSCTTCSNPVASPAGTTTYTVTVTDNAGGTMTDNVTITVNPLPTATATNNGPVCAGGNVTLTGGANGMTSYTWSGPSGYSSTAQSPVVSPAVAGTYTLTISNGTCTNTASTTVVVNALPTATATNNGPVCVGTALTLTGGNNGMTSYSWSGPSSFSSTSQSPSVSASATLAMAGTYTLTISDGTCTNTASTVVTVTSLPTATATNNGPMCEGSSLDLTGGNNGMVSYSWTGPNGFSSTSQSPNVSPNATGVMAGTYTLTISDGTCTNTASTVVMINLLPVPNLGPDVGTCLGSGVQLNASGGGTYSWTPATDLSCTTCSNPVASPADTTTYTVTVVGANGCSASEDIVVNIYNAPPANAGPDVAICSGSSTTLGATGGVTFAWSPATGLSSTSSSSPVASPATTTTYFVTVSDVAGCSAVDTVVVTVNPLPAANAGSNATICPGDSTTLNASGGISYVWSPSATLSDANIFNPVATPAATTTYTVTVTDSNGCSETDNVTVTVSIPAADAGSDVDICLGSSTILSASGGNTYAWSPGTGLSSATVSNPTASPATTTIYVVTVTNAAGCTASDAVTVTVNPLPTADAGTDATICNGGSANLAATGGSTYAWSPGTGLSSTSISNPVASPNTTTVYTVTVTDANGCTDSDYITVNVDAAPVANAGIDQGICLGETATLTATGGGSYAWNTGDTTANVNYTPSVTTTYVVTVSYTNGCTSSDDVVITVYSIPVVDLVVDPSVFAYTGQIVTFTALPAGYAIYNFYVDGTLVQTGSSNVYETNTLTNNPVVSVTATDNGCESALEPLPYEIKPIPNAFTPYDLDGKNDIFVKGLDMTVFNRWNEIIYEGADGWDGKFNGTLVAPGTYYYIIRIKDLNNVINEIHGSVTVVDNK